MATKDHNNPQKTAPDAAQSQKSSDNTSADAPAKKRQPKGSARKARRAREAEEERRRQEQAAHDRKVKSISVLISIIVVVALIIGLVFVIHHNNSQKANTAEMSAQERQAYEALQAVSVKPSHATDTGGFVLTKNYDFKPIDNAPTIEDYFDALCPGCGQVHRSIGPEMKQMVEAGQVNYEIHPNGFLDRLTTDDYCTRAAAAIAYVAENDPSHVIAFMEGLYDENFQPSESDYQTVSDDQIIKVAKDAGVDSDVADKCTDGTYTEWIQALRNYTPLRSETQNVAGDSKGSMTTPTIIINGHLWNLLELTSTDYANLILQAIGLSKDQVGTSTMPSIGADGTALIGQDYLTQSSDASSAEASSGSASASTEESTSSSSSTKTTASK
ncbi:MAG: thioredoxin domain-containing protein [Bifidobacteriaceae bacterium]|nr:thioredoxin domain-containing protein [Bifidobacteriaceae bacterium]